MSFFSQWAMLTVLSKFSNSLCRKMLNWSARAPLSSFQFLLSAKLSATDSVSFLSVGLVSLWIISLYSLGQTFKSLLQKHLFVKDEKRNGDLHQYVHHGRTWLYEAVYWCQASALKKKWSVFIGVISTQSKIWWFGLFFWWERNKNKNPLLSNLKYYLQGMLNDLTIT